MAVVVAILPFGTVHEPFRCLVAVVLALGAAAAGQTAFSAPSRATVGIAAVAAVGFLAPLLWLVPLPDAAVAWTSTSVRPLVAESHGLIGASAGPMALYPRGALIGAAFGLAAILVGAVSATVVRNSRVAGWLGGMLVAVGLATFGVAIVHWGLDVTAPWGLSGWTGPRHGFFGPFVYPNDGGLLCAALIPIAVGVGTREDGRYLVPFGVVAMVLAGAVWVSDSRAAVLVAVLGIGAFAMLRGSTTVRVGVGVGGVLAMLALVVVGPAQAIGELTTALAPEDHFSNSDTYSGRPSMWGDAARAWWNVPLGTGLRGFEDANRMFKSGTGFGNATHAHVEPLEALVESGPLALLLIGPLVAVLALGVRTGLTRHDDRGAIASGFTAALLCILVFSFVDFPFRIGALATLTAVVAGAVVGLADDEPVAERAGLIWRVVLGIGAVVVVALSGAAVAATDRGSWFGSPERRLQDGDGWMLHSTAPDDQAMQHAREHYRLGLQARPLYSPLALRMARLEGRGRHPDRARAWLELGARIDPTSPYMWTNLARVARSEGRREDEREAWRRLLGLSTEHEIWLSRATEATSGSKNLVDEALAVIPEDRLCAFAARLPAARAAESDALFTVAGNKPGCQVGWAFSAFVRGEPGAALAHLGDATGCQAEQMRVMAGVAVGNYAEANDIARRSLAECGAGDRHVRTATARARFALGDDSGYAILEGILRENPRDAVVRRLLAEQLLSEGRKAEAKRHFQYLVTAGIASPSDRAHLLEIE